MVDNPGIPPEALLQELSRFIAEATGLYFPKGKWTDLSRGMDSIAADLGFAETADCAEWLMTERMTESRLQVLASRLTIGETYFQRDRRTFEALASTVLPQMIESRRGGNQQLRLWSAGCCSGEETYSLAILLRQVCPDLAGWRITILGTDINTSSLRKAEEGLYGEWSFRETPAEFKARYFRTTAEGRYQIAREIQDMVTFVYLNLADAGHFSHYLAAGSVDLILCRNVLMYFSEEQAKRVIERFSEVLAPEGWLVVSPTEASHALFPQFRVRNLPGSILYQKATTVSRNQAPPASHPTEPACANTASQDCLPPEMFTGIPLDPKPVKLSPIETSSPALSGRNVSVPETSHREISHSGLSGRTRETDPIDSKGYAMVVQVLADQGKLEEALEWCGKWTAAHKLDPFAYYLTGVILVEKGDHELARQALRSAAYLDPDSPLIHLALGNLARRGGRLEESERHLNIARSCLNKLPPDEVLPDAGGLAAGWLKETIAQLTLK